MQCSGCREEVNPGEVFEYQGEKLCEDCYLDRVAQPKTCDPWAVYHAKQTAHQGGQELTEDQSRIYELLKESEPLSREDVCARLGMSQDEFARNFATLRHLELASACQVNGEKRFTTFEAATK